MRAASSYVLLLVLLWSSGCGRSHDEADRPDVQHAPLVAPAAAEHLVAAQEAFRHAEYDRALALADSAERRTGGSPPAFLADITFLRARIFTELNRSDEALDAYEKVLSLKPDYRGAARNLGNAAYRSGQYSEALDYYRREYTAHPDPALFTFIGRTHFELGQVDSARQAYERAITADDTLAQPYIRLAQLYEADGAFEQALTYARRGFALEPDHSGYRYLVGTLLLRTGQAEDALRHLSAVARVRPHDHEVQYNIGQALMRLGRSDEAEPHLAAADSLRAIEAAVNKWKTLTTLYADQPAVWATYGYALHRADRWEEAVRAYHAALHLDNENEEVRFQLANLHLERGELEQAVAQYRTILQQDPTVAGAWLNVGIAYVRAGRLEAARRAWMRTLEHEPGHPQARAYLARLDGSPQDSAAR